MNENAKHLHDVSAFYFFVLAFMYIVLALSFRNDVFADVAMVMMRVLDIPFAMVALAYGGSALSLQLTTKEDEDEDDDIPPPWNTVIFAICFLMFGMVVFINFSFPSLI